MSFAFPELVIESVIRDGLEDIKNNPEFLDDVFGEFTKSYATRKYGQAEIDKIKALIDKKNIAVVHSFHEAAAKSPCYSIQLGLEAEDRQTTHLDDFEDDLRVPITEAARLELLVKADNVVPSDYTPTTGKVSVPDSVDLSGVYAGYIFEDGAGNIHKVLPGISNAPGDKFFFVAPNSNVDTVDPGEIRSFITEDQFEVRSVSNEVRIMIGVHTKQALLTKYLYVLLKYFLLSRKADAIKRCFARMSLEGSDFTRDFEYQGDMVFTRFLTIKGYTDDVWRSDQVNLIDAVEIDGEAILNSSGDQGLPNEDDC